MKTILLSILLLSYGTLWAQNASHTILASTSKPFNETIFTKAQNPPRIYPNPTQDKTTVLIEKEYTSIHLKVVNTMGQTMLTKLEVEGNYYTFDLVDLTVGSYYILITIDGQTEALSVVKE